MDYFEMLPYVRLGFLFGKHPSPSRTLFSWEGGGDNGPSIVYLHEQPYNFVLLISNIGGTSLRFNNNPDPLVILDHFLNTP